MQNQGTTEPSTNFTFEMRNSHNYLIHNFIQTVKVTTAEASKFTNGSIQVSSLTAGV